MTVRICNVSQKTLSSCLAIAEIQLGKGYLLEKDLLGTHVYSVCGVANGEVAGFAAGRILDRRCLAGPYPKLAEAVHDVLLRGDRIGVVASVAVRQDLQRSGIGTALVQKVVQYFDDQNITQAILLGWVAPDGVPIARIASAMGFAEKAVVPECWYDDSLSRGYLCPACGYPPCRCSAVLYARYRPDYR